MVIDIGCSTSQDNVNQTHYSNKIAPEPTSSFGRNDNYAPPAYSINMIGFCSRCGVARRDLTAQYCSSCGQLFN
ncbi:unnamed protein product [Rotaria magnacalcarata]|uniref:Uncharacterized protein n=1 Tax=Rotaria magnacalcarata TaxID=392030 RepID=A0A8S3EWI5_9BILA|nr:unnamed protein product [Rotaria magnacalcarata]